jgi:nucleotide-binding universal stress UspA family protein
LAQAIDGRPDYQAGAREILAAAIAQTRAADSDAEVHPHVVLGPPAQVLADAAEGAELLVVAAGGAAD